MPKKKKNRMKKRKLKIGWHISPNFIVFKKNVGQNVGYFGLIWAKF